MVQKLCGSQKIWLVLWGGQVTFPTDKSDKNKTVIPPVVFKKLAIVMLIVGAVIFFCLPLILVDNCFGLIDMKYPADLVGLDNYDQYTEILWRSLFVALIGAFSMKELITVEVPLPVSSGWKLAVGYIFLVFHAILVCLVIWFIIRIKQNMKSIRSERLNRKHDMEVSYASIL